MKNRITRLILSSFFAFVIVGTVLTAGVGTAFAQTQSSPQGTRVTVQMKVLGPDGSTTGPCGTLTFYVFNQGGGDAEFYEYVSSSEGAIITLSYAMNWLNHRNGWSNGISNSYFLPSNPWVNEDHAYTQPGLVTASIQVNDHVGAPWPFGQSCVGYENDYDTIT